MNYQMEAAKLVLVALEDLETSLNLENLLAVFEVPKKAEMGDHAFPCFILAKILKKAPPMIAKELAEKIPMKSNFSKIEALGPYLNFTINKAGLAESIIPQILNGSFLAKRHTTNTRTMIEYSQPNTHKVFHVGHTRNVALGDALVRICEWAGDDVIAVNYIGDVGTHIAKCLWQYQKSNETYENQSKQITRGEFLGNFYVQADKELDFSQITDIPITKVLSAKVIKKAKHPKNNKWNIVQLDIGSKQLSIVCALDDFHTGDIVACAQIGAKIAGRSVGITDKMGITSEGMICSEAELTISDKENVSHKLPTDTAIGIELAEIYRKENSKLAKDQKVLDFIKTKEEEVSQILQKLESKEKEIYNLWRQTKEWSMNDFKEVYQWLGARFDHYFYESEVSDSGKELVKEFLSKKIFIKSEGAIGVNLEKYKLPFFLVLKSDGTSLYSTKDLSLAQLKFEKYKIDKSIYVVDSSQALHFQQVFRTLELMGYKQAKKCHHLSYGMVVGPEGKMSSRKGNVVPFSQLRSRLLEKVNTDYLTQYKDKWPQNEITETAKRISIATIKYGMLNSNNNNSIVFDLEEWTARSGNTGPYMMYAYARTRSILRELQHKTEIDYKLADWKLLEHENEQKLLRKMISFPDTVLKAAEKYEPQILCIYLYELSKDFSRMYDSCSILHAENKELQMARAALVEAFGKIVQKGLELIGIPSVERM